MDSTVLFVLDKHAVLRTYVHKNITYIIHLACSNCRKIHYSMYARMSHTHICRLVCSNGRTKTLQWILAFLTLL